jgi:hypothetical protein
MRKTTIVLALTAALIPLAGYPSPPRDDESQEAKWARLAAQTKPGPCPTEIEVLPYQWIEPTTGMEYTMLRLHCPGRDELDGESPSTSGNGHVDEDVPAPVRSAG